MKSVFVADLGGAVGGNCLPFMMKTPSWRPILGKKGISYPDLNTPFFVFHSELWRYSIESQKIFPKKGPKISARLWHAYFSSYF